MEIISIVQNGGHVFFMHFSTIVQRDNICDHVYVQYVFHGYHTKRSENVAVCISFLSYKKERKRRRMYFLSIYKKERKRQRPHVRMFFPSYKKERKRRRRYFSSIIQKGEKTSGTVCMVFFLSYKETLTAMCISFHTKVKSPFLCSSFVVQFHVAWSQRVSHFDHKSQAILTGLVLGWVTMHNLLV